MPVIQSVSLYIHYLTPDSVFWILAVLILAVLVYRSYRYEAIVFTTSLILTTATIGVMKISFAVARPVDVMVNVSSYAFPSGHAGSSMFLAVMGSWLVYRTSKKHIYVLYFVFFTLAFLIGLSRVFIHAHTPLQVEAGFVIGILVPLATIWLFANHVSDTQKRR